MNTELVVGTVGHGTAAQGENALWKKIHKHRTLETCAYPWVLLGVLSLEADLSFCISQHWGTGGATL